MIENEIIPVLGEQQEVDKWIPTAAASDVVVDAIGLVSEAQSEATLDGWISSCKIRSEKGKPKSMFVWTTGCMVYGTAGLSLSRLLTEDDPPVPDPHHLHGAPRVMLEEKFRKAGAVIIRPGWVYGLNGGQSDAFFFGQINTEKKTVTIKGRGDKSYSWIHISDLADAYVRLCEQPQEKVAGQVFNFNARDYPSYEEIIMAGIKAAGIPDPTVVRVEVTEKDEAHWLETMVKIDPKKTEDVLGWKPKHIGFLQEMELYYPGWASAQKKS